MRNINIKIPTIRVPYSLALSLVVFIIALMLKASFSEGTVLYDLVNTILITVSICIGCYFLASIIGIIYNHYMDKSNKEKEESIYNIVISSMLKQQLSIRNNNIDSLVRDWSGFKQACFKSIISHLGKLYFGVDSNKEGFSVELMNTKQVNVVIFIIKKPEEEQQSIPLNFKNTVIQIMRTERIKGISKIKGC